MSSIRCLKTCCGPHSVAWTSTHTYTVPTHALTLSSTSSNCWSVTQPRLFSSCGAKKINICQSDELTNHPKLQLFLGFKNCDQVTHSHLGSPVWTAAPRRSGHGACSPPGKCFQLWNSYRYKTADFRLSRPSLLYSFQVNQHHTQKKKRSKTTSAANW